MERRTTRIGKGGFSSALGAICILLSVGLAAPFHAENILDKIEKTGKAAIRTHKMIDHLYFFRLMH